MGLGYYGHGTTNNQLEVLTYFVHNKVIIEQICTGYEHSMALSNGYRVYAWGRNREGQCGIGTNDTVISEPKLIDYLDKYTQIIDIKANGYNSYAKSDSNEHWLWGDNEYGQCTLELRQQPIEDDCKNVPYHIDTEFYGIHTKRKIEQVYLGEQAVYIVARLFSVYVTNTQSSIDSLL